MVQNTRNVKFPFCLRSAIVPYPCKKNTVPPYAPCTSQHYQAELVAKVKHAHGHGDEANSTSYLTRKTAYNDVSKFAEFIKLKFAVVCRLVVHYLHLTHDCLFSHKPGVTLEVLHNLQAAQCHYYQWATIHARWSSRARRSKRSLGILSLFTFYMPTKEKPLQ